MRRGFYLGLLLSLSVGMGAQQQSSSSSQSPADASQPNTVGQNSPSDTSNGADNGDSKPAKKPAPDLTPPRSDRVNADDLGSGLGESSSKDTQIDLSPPADDARTHPQSAEALAEATGTTHGGVGEFHIWDPHKAAKSVEVGDFYFKRKNYRAAEDRYREALSFKDNDAIATFRLAVCLEKLDRPDDAREEYESYLRILPHGPQAEESQRAIERLKAPAASAKPAK